MEAEKENRFSSFLLSINIFKKTDSIQKEIQRERALIDKELDFIIQTNNSTQLRVFKEKGVLVSFKQLKNIIFEREELLNSIDLKKHSEVYVDELKEFILKEFKKIILKEFKKMTNTSLGMGMGLESAKNASKVKMFTSLAQCLTKSGIGSNFNEEELHKLYEYSVKIKEKSQSDILNSHRYPNFSFYADEVNTIIERKYNETKKAHINSLAERAKLLKSDFSGVKEQVAVDFLNNLKKFDENNLNPKAQPIFNEIKLLFLELNKTELDARQKFEVENLYVKRLPQVISEYVSIPARYKEQLKGNSDSPDNLLVDSLTEIKGKLLTIHEAVQSENVTQMKVTNKYLRSI